MTMAWLSKQKQNALKTVTSGDSCPTCREGNLVVAATGQREIVCEACGGALPISKDLLSPGSEKFGRGIQSFAVLGDNMGSMMSMRNGNGKSDLYYLRGRGVVQSLMPGHLTGIEEPNKHLASLKLSLVPMLVHAQAKGGRNVTGDQGTEISNGLKAWFKEVKRKTALTNSICAARSKHDTTLEDKILLFKGNFGDSYIKTFRGA